MRVRGRGTLVAAGGRAVMSTIESDGDVVGMCDDDDDDDDDDGDEEESRFASMNSMNWRMATERAR